MRNIWKFYYYTSTSEKWINYVGILENVKSHTVRILFYIFDTKFMLKLKWIRAWSTLRVKLNSGSDTMRETIFHFGNKRIRQQRPIVVNRQCQWQQQYRQTQKGQFHCLDFCRFMSYALEHNKVEDFHWNFFIY